MRARFQNFYFLFPRVCGGVPNLEKELASAKAGRRAGKPALFIQFFYFSKIIGVLFGVC